MVIRQYDIFLVNLDPTIGHEIRKDRRRLVKKLGKRVFGRSIA
jgi:mRNA-degrading endonuclease toxin of MazEF toxin-antitoxin module